MKIAVIIPTKNRPALLKKCIESLARQNYPKSEYEIIIVDDGSDTGEAEYIVSGASKNFKNVNVRYVKQACKGPAAARNNGVKNTSATIVAFIDDDCTASRNWLKSIDVAFSVNKDAWAVEGKTMTNGRIGPFSHYVINENGRMFVTCNMAFKKSALNMVGFFDERFKRANREDSDIAFSIIEKGGSIVFSKKSVVKHANLVRSFSASLRRKTYYMWDVLLIKKHPQLYRKFIKFPFERFTPLYIMFSLMAVTNPLFFVALIITAYAEIIYRRHSCGIYDYIKFLFLQIFGSFLVVLSALYGVYRFRGLRK